MAKLIKTRVAQNVLSAEFVFNFNDTMVNASGVLKDFGLTTVAETNAFSIIPLPKGAIVLGGEVIRPTAFDTAGYDITVGDSAVIDRYLSATDLKGTGRTALVPTGYVGDGEDIRLGIQCDDVCTTGKCIVRVEYIVPGISDVVAL